MAAWVLLLLCSTGALAQGRQSLGQNELIRWLKGNGGEVGLEVGLVNDEGLRGTIAARDFQAGDMVALLPRNCTVPLGLQSLSAPELAAALLRMRRERPEQWAFFAPYWASLPGPGSVSSKYLISDEQVELMQVAGMAEFMQHMRAHLRAVHERKSGAIGEPDGAGDLGVPLEEFWHYTGLVDSYVFIFPDEAGRVRHMLLPLLDLINHRGDANSAIALTEDGTAFVVAATKDIRKGEEVTHRYNWAIERNDRALLDHFFLSSQQPPWLCAIDLPGGSIYEVLDEPPAADRRHAPGGPLCTEAEAQRLAGILAQLPTSEQQDRELLDSGELGDWRERAVVRFRMLRKLALQNTIESILAALATGRPRVVVPLQGVSDRLQEPRYIQIRTE